MINFTLYKRGMQGSWKTLLIFAAVLAMYFAIIISMFNPEIGSALEEFAKAMPELMAMVGMTPASAELISFMSAYLYGFIMLVFPMIFSIIIANKLIASHVDKGSMTYLVAAPVKRSTVVFTQMKVLCTGLFALVLFATVLGIVVCEISFPGELDIVRFALLNAGVLCLQLFISGICFLASCVFNESKYAVSAGAGIPALAFIIQMLANAGQDLEKFKYATFFTLFNPDGIIAGEASAYLGMAILLVGAIALFALSIIVFSRKDLHI
ncbi:MAG TPA: ABC transporter permease [Clostridiales bacterium]|jgi:ABC-2 type transport system permease protein|nr:ABC transporter permease [Clostridiales bacterium]